MNNLLVILILIITVTTIQTLILNNRALNSKTPGIETTSKSKPRIQARVIHSPVLDFAPWLELHHIILLQEIGNPKVACTIDFSPLNQRSLNTISQLLQNKYMPAEIRINWIDDFNDGLDSIKSLAINSTKIMYNRDNINIYKLPPNNVNPEFVEFVNNLSGKWPSNMNFYTHNCQHFSDYVTAVVRYHNEKDS